MASRRGKGDGSLTQRHDHPTCPPAVDGKRPEHTCRGRWVATLDLGWSGGKRHRKVMYGATRKEAKIKLDTALREHDAGTLVVASPTVEKWLRYWLDVICPERELKTNTLKSHRSKVERYLIPYLGRHRVDRLAPEHLRTMYADMRARGLSEATLRQTHAVLRRALVVAEREGKCARNVATLIDPPKTTKNHRKGLSLADAQRVLAVADLRWYVALYLGLRQGEALALCWSDIDLDAGVLSVTRSLVRKPGVGLVFESPKSLTSIRDVPLPPKVLARFKVARIEHDQAGGDPDGLVFHRDGRPIDHRADWQEWRDLLVRATVPPWAPIPHVALHAARNTTASLLEEIGIPDRMVAQILGQSTVQVTHGYQHADLDRMRQAMLGLEAHLAPRELGD